MEDIVEKIEPWVAGAQLAGWGLVASGAGSPVGAVLLPLANITGAAIDTYQLGEGLYNTYKSGNWSLQNPELQKAIVNGGEIILDLMGAKAASSANKMVKAGRSPMPEYSYRYNTRTKKKVLENNKKHVQYQEDYRKAWDESIRELNRRGVRHSDGDYFYRKLFERIDKKMVDKGWGLTPEQAQQINNRNSRWVNFGFSVPTISYDIFGNDILENNSDNKN